MNIDLQKDLSDFDIHENTLVANVELIWEYHSDFRKACQSLLTLEHDHVILDLSNVDFIFSAYMGTIGYLLTESTRLGKRLTIRISRNLQWLFEMVKLESMTDIEIVT